jgi:hypothetical protein
MSGGLATASEIMSSTAVNAGAAQSSGAHVLYQDFVIPVGLAHGQTLQYIWANLNDPDPEKREFEPLRIRVRLLAADGSVIAQTEAAAVGAGHSQYFYFDRDRISLPGEAGTGRLQARLEVTVTGRTTRSDTVPEQVILESSAGSAEVIDNFSGKTTVKINARAIWRKLRIRQEFPSSQEQTQVVIYTRSGLIAAIPGQTIRAAWANFSAEDPRDRVLELLSVNVKLFNAAGDVIAQTDAAPAQAGRFDYSDFNRNLIGLPGEPGTGRLPLRVEMTARFRVAHQVDATVLQKALEDFPASLELIDNSTGRTYAVWVTVGFFEVAEGYEPNQNGAGIMIQSSASGARLISNTLSGNSLIDQGSQMQSFGSITDP